MDMSEIEYALIVIRYNVKILLKNTQYEEAKEILKRLQLKIEDAGEICEEYIEYRVLHEGESA